MIHLPHGCRCSELKVSPSNWNSRGASCDDRWRIYYRFYDPTFEKPYLVQIKAGINQVKDLQERRTMVKGLINQEIHKLTTLSFNPITGQIDLPEEFEYEIDPSTPFIKALEKAWDKLNVARSTKKGIKAVIKGVGKAAMQLRLNTHPINTITRRHIKAILDQCGKNSRSWSATSFNLYRAYLMMLYNELVELEAVPGNPIRDIGKRSIPVMIKDVLSKEQRKKITEHLQVVNPRFLTFIQLFFHSGGRKTELLSLKPGNVSLSKQKYRCIVKKGKKQREVERTIKDVAVPLWVEFLKDCPAGSYIFGPHLLPGEKPMGEGMPTRYWKKYVKDPEDEGGLGIDIDFYSLKHLNTSEVVDALDEQAAAELNAHTSTAMVVNIYDVKQKDRQHERLKKVNNTF